MSIGSARTIRGGPGQARDGGTFGIRRTHDILIPYRQSAELAAAARRGNPGAVSEIPLEDDTQRRVVAVRIAPRPVPFITTDNDRLVPPEDSDAVYRRAGESKKSVMLHGFGHAEVYTGEAFPPGDAAHRCRSTCRR